MTTSSARSLSLPHASSVTRLGFHSSTIAKPSFYRFHNSTLRTADILGHSFDDQTLEKHHQCVYTSGHNRFALIHCKIDSVSQDVIGPEILPCFQFPSTGRHAFTCHKQPGLHLPLHSNILCPSNSHQTPYRCASASSFKDLHTMAIASKEEQVATARTSPSVQHHSRTCSNGSGNTNASDTCTNTTYDSATPCLSESSRNLIAAHDVEQNMSLRQCLTRYPKAILWSVLFSLTLIMEGYSTILVPNLYSLDPFLRQFGTRQLDGDYEISALWQSALVNSALGGQIGGLFLGGWSAEKNGYRKTLMAALIAVTAFIPITFFAKSKTVLLVGQCLLGAPWGVFQTISTVYASDILPVGLRGYLTTYVSLIPRP